VKLTFGSQDAGELFRVHRLGLHEEMPAGMIDRPEGTRDYLFMLFHSSVQVRTSRRETRWTSPGLIAWTPADGHYYGQPATTWDHSWFHCSGRAVASILKKTRIPLRQRIEITDPSLMERFLTEVAAEFGAWRQPDTVILRNLFENFVRAVVRQASRKSERLAPPALLALRAHLEQHFTERPRLVDLAKRAGWSEPHLCAQFRRFFGLPVLRFVQQLRMNHASYLLRDQNRRIGEVAQLTGYPDLYAFSKMFKHYQGVSPRRFRELISPGEPATFNCRPRPGQRPLRRSGRPESRPIRTFLA
jgi:AraC family transcriptional regulator of arabinose operon